MELLLKVDFLVIHHSERDKDCMEFIKVRHKQNREWEDIGYHYVIEKNGKLKTGRNEKYVGAHVYGHNKNSLGICLVGNFNENLPTKKQIKTLLKIIKKKRKQYNIPLKHVIGHREFRGVTKTCPGKRIDMNKLRLKLK